MTNKENDSLNFKDAGLIAYILSYTADNPSFEKRRENPLFRPFKHSRERYFGAYTV